jgi:hypothetical protein
MLPALVTAVALAATPPLTPAAQPARVLRLTAGTRTIDAVATSYCLPTQLPTGEEGRACADGAGPTRSLAVRSGLRIRLRFGAKVQALEARIGAVKIRARRTPNDATRFSVRVPTGLPCSAELQLFATYAFGSADFAVRLKPTGCSG